jgi:hypothetical protein
MSEKLLPDETSDGKTSTDLIVVRHSGLRTVEPTAVLESLGAASLRLPRHEMHIDTSIFKEAVDGGDWSGHVAYLRQQIASIDQVAERCSRPELHYFGLPEVPHAIAAGGLLGDERYVHIHEFDRDADRWTWPAHDRTLTLTTSGVPTMPAVTARGTAILRVSISAAISPADVREVVGDEHLADVEISMEGDRAPGITRVRSEADLEHVRLTFREAFAALRAARPNIELIYLFVAAPVSVCFAIGQELKPRNSPPIQTFRYRSHSEQPSQQFALLLSAEDQGVEPAAIVPEELRSVRAARSGPLADALHDVLDWARRQRGEGTPERPWFKPLHLPVLEDCRPYRGLPALHAVVAEGATVDPNGGLGEYAYDKDQQVWRLPDRLVLSWRATFPDDVQLRRAFRLFLFHEYVHDYQTLTATTAKEVGKFGSVLEHIDYVADSYALLHELAYQQEEALSPGQLKGALDELIEVMLCALWAFAPTAGSSRWDVRQLRRFMNWYWRQVQVRRAPGLAEALQLLSSVPRVEIGGLAQFARGRRVLVALDRTDPSTHLELGLLLEDDRLFRQGETANTSIRELLAAFQGGRHKEIQTFFSSVFVFASQTGGALPRSPDSSSA